MRSRVLIVHERQTSSNEVLIVVKFINPNSMCHIIYQFDELTSILHQNPIELVTRKADEKTEVVLEI